MTEHLPHSERRPDRHAVRHTESRSSSAWRSDLVRGVATVVAAVAFAAMAHADSPPASETDRTLAAQRFGYGIELGYGAGIAPRQKQQGRDVSDVQTFSIQPGMRIRIAQLGDGVAWYHGRLDGTLAGLVLLNFDPRVGVGGGALAGLRFTGRPTSRLQPYFDGALGVGGLDFDLQSQADALAFFIQAGFGARWRLDEDFSLTGAFRWQHVSNAQTQDPNAGIGTLGFQLGVDFR